MAKQTVIDHSTALRKQEIISKLASSRRDISAKRGVIKNQLSPKSQLSSLFAKNPKRAVISSAVLGLVLTSLLKRKKTRRQRILGGKRVGRKGLIMTLAGWGIALAKPSIKSLILKQATTMASKQLSQRQNQQNYPRNNS